MIQLEDVALTYSTPEGDRRALSKIDLRIEEGEFVCIVGPSGCGKTSLLNLIAGFLRPSAGTVRIGDRTVSGPGPDRGVVFQEPTLFPWLTVWGNVAFGLRRQGRPREDVKKRTAEALALVGLTGHEKAYPHMLSGGMRQRVSIARVVVLGPQAMLMDEPFSALDTNSRERLQDELVRIWRATRSTILYVTHSVEEAAYLGDRVIIMGPPPHSILEVCDTDIPRDRGSDELRRKVSTLREKLNRIPCCVGGIGNTVDTPERIEGSGT